MSQRIYFPCGQNETLNGSYSIVELYMSNNLVFKFTLKRLLEELNNQLSDQLMKIKGSITRDEIDYIRNMQFLCKYGLIVLWWCIDIYKLAKIVMFRKLNFLGLDLCKISVER